MFAIKRAEPPSDRVVEYWTRDIADPLDEARFRVDASKSLDNERWPWQVDVWAMGSVRDIPLEKELRGEILKALRAVPGVARASEGDREFWIVNGQPSGEALITAVSAVLDGYSVELRAYVRSP